MSAKRSFLSLRTQRRTIVRVRMQRGRRGLAKGHAPTWACQKPTNGSVWAKASS